MTPSSVTGDFLSALVVSTLFWLTAAGIAMRALRVDFAKLEGYLKNVYAQLDHFTFSAF